MFQLNMYLNDYILNQPLDQFDVFTIKWFFFLNKDGNLNGGNLKGGSNDDMTMDVQNVQNV